MIDLTPFVAALPVVVTLAKILVETLWSGSERRLARHLEMLKAAPEESAARAELMSMVDAESRIVRARVEVRLNRKLHGATLAAMLFVVVVTTPIVWALWSWSTTPMWTPFQIILQAIAVALGLFGVLLAGVGGGSQLWVQKQPAAESSEVQGTS